MITLPVGDIIRDSFKLAWKYKYLWLFGLFISGNFGSGLSNTGGDDQLSLEKLEAYKEWVLATLAAVVLIGLLVFLVFIVLHVISKNALIYNVYQIETHGAPGLGAGWDFGLKRFWPMLGLTLIEGVVIFTFVMAMVLVAVIAFKMAVALGVLSLLFLIPVGLLGICIIAMTWLYAERFVALETRGVVESIGEGWSLLRSQWKPSAMMMLVKIGIAIAASIGIMGVGAALFIPAIPLWLLSKPLAIVYGIIVILPYLIVAGAYFGTFDSSVWTKAFLHLRAPAYASGAASDAAPEIPPETPRQPPLFE